jgi:hypothetical protein
MLSKLLRTSIISGTVAFLTLSAISLKSLAESYRTIILTNNNEQPISRVRIRPVNTKGKWHKLMPLTDYLEVGESKTFNVSTDQCEYTLVVDYINGSLDPSFINVCDGDKTTPIRRGYTGNGGDYNIVGKYIGDNPDCQHIPSWVSGITVPEPVCR